MEVISSSVTLKNEFTLAQLRVFLAIIEYASLTSAASELDMSQSAVSHALAELERNLGVRLLERGRFGAKPTAVGERIARHARMMQTLERSIHSEVNLELGELHGHLRIASFRSVATHLLPDVVTQFGRVHANVSFEIQSLEGMDRGVERTLLEGRADLGVLMLPCSPTLDALELAKDEWMAVFPKNKAPRGKYCTWADLERLPFLLCNEAGANAVRTYWNANGQQMRQVAQVEDDSVILSMVAHSFGLSVLARLAMEPVPEGVVLRHLPEPLERRFAVATMPALNDTPLVRAFKAFITDKKVLERCAVVKRGVLQLP
jgi:DNA-binding transcriptional LysR family regulator